MRFLFYLLLALLAAPAWAQRRLPGWEPDNAPDKRFQPPPSDVRGAVAVVTVRDSALTPENKIYNGLGPRRYYFDAQGRIRRRVNLDRRTGQPFADVRYDAHGRVTRRSHTADKGYFTVCQYQDRRRQRITLVCSPDSVVSARTVESFDRRGQLLRAESFQADGQLTSSTTYRYDRHGELTEQLFRNTPLGAGISSSFGPTPTFTPWPNDTLRHYTDYDQRGRPISQAWYRNGQLQRLLAFTHGDTSLVRSVRFAGSLLDGHPHIREVYTAGAYRLERNHYVSTFRAQRDSLAHHVHWQRYWHDELVEAGYELDGVEQNHRLHTMADETDAHGNRIKRTFLTNGQPQRLELRSIDYRGPQGRATAETKPGR
ncbi:hypothetical protein LJ737_22930 [Hymenobacter sp. 15J16-1T3B]|uniref:hypothetical protein n=1 Tax=Hymenobacter sp. 15J16-1T3B TaxID=2886941 RepID=UPI001D124AEF|nr:hypothetical protein [Hymenobacter sp. 15J16-1T3B]MCC3160108.1 hypothetical protein [Hymenobacter sp. 15J16-1T3B]